MQENVLVFKEHVYIDQELGVACQVLPSARISANAKIPSAFRVLVLLARPIVDALVNIHIPLSELKMFTEAMTAMSE